MKIKNIKKDIYTKDYIKDRNLYWEKKLQEYKNNNTPLWNGSVYYLDQIENNKITIGLFEYKDLIFIENKGLDWVKTKYNLSFNFIYINVQILIENDDEEFLFGTKKKNGFIELISVGGTLRLEDEDEIKNFIDIKNYAKKEILIETKINFSDNYLSFIDIILENNICTFLFHYRVKKTNQSLLKIGEFDGEIYLKKENIFSKNNNLIPNIRLESISNFLRKKWNIKKQ